MKSFDVVQLRAPFSLRQRVQRQGACGFAWVGGGEPRHRGGL